MFCPSNWMANIEYDFRMLCFRLCVWVCIERLFLFLLLVLLLLLFRQNVWQPQNTCTQIYNSITIHVKVHGIPNNHYLKPTSYKSHELTSTLLIVPLWFCRRSKYIHTHSRTQHMQYPFWCERVGKLLGTRSGERANECPNAYERNLHKTIYKWSRAESRRIFAKPGNGPIAK